MLGRDWSMTTSNAVYCLHSPDQVQVSSVSSEDGTNRNNAGIPDVSETSSDDECAAVELGIISHERSSTDAALLTCRQAETAM